MFDNIGKKIKTLAVVICGIGIVLSVIGGIAVWVAIDDEIGALAFLGVAAGGSLLSWIGSFFTYGFGELIDKVSNIECVITPTNALPGTPAAQNRFVPTIAPSVPQGGAQARENPVNWNSSTRFLGDCEICGKTEVSVTKVTVVNGNGTTRKNACKKCFEAVNSK